MPVPEAAVLLFGSLLLLLLTESSVQLRHWGGAEAVKVVSPVVVVV